MHEIIALSFMFFFRISTDASVKLVRKENGSIFDTSVDVKFSNR